MTTSFSPDTFNILNFSKEEASRLHCGSVSPLHLLLGIIRHTDNKARLTNALGKYDTGWTYLQFHRLPKHSTVNIAIEQND